MAQIPLSSKLAAYLVTLGTFTTSVGTYLLAGGEMPFNWGDYSHDIGLTMNLIGLFSTYLTVALRRDSLPFVTSGVGTEPAASTTTTLEVKKTINTEDGH